MAVKKESHKRKKLLIAQQQLIHAGSGSYNKVGETSGINKPCQLVTGYHKHCSHLRKHPRNSSSNYLIVDLWF